MKNIFTLLSGVLMVLFLTMVEETSASVNRYCVNNKGLTLSFTTTVLQSKAESIYNLNSGTANGQKFFHDIMESSRLCSSLNLMYTSGTTPFGTQYICEGEVYAPSIYGQIVVSGGGIDKFLNAIAPAAGWNCIIE